MSFLKEMDGLIDELVLTEIDWTAKASSCMAATASSSRLDSARSPFFVPAKERFSEDTLCRDGTELKKKKKIR